LDAEAKVTKEMCEEKAFKNLLASDEDTDDENKTTSKNFKNDTGTYLFNS